MSMLIPKNIFADAPRWVLKFLSLTVALSILPQVEAAVIDLSKPVSESITVNGIYWKADTITTGSTPDSAGTLNGILEAGNGTPTPAAPSLVSGVFSNALALVSNTTDAVSDRNARIYRNSSDSKLNMNATDFTGGAWLKFNSLPSRAQRVVIMDRGGQATSAATNGGGWTFFLDKSALGDWRFGFTARDSTADTTVYSSAITGISLDKWIHFGFAFDDIDGSANKLTFFLNGTALPTIDINRDITAALSTTVGRRFSVGERSGSNYDSTFNGAIDDIFVTTGLHSFQAVVPEPGSVTLITVAAAGLLAFGKVRRHKSASR